MIVRKGKETFKEKRSVQIYREKWRERWTPQGREMCLIKSWTRDDRGTEEQERGQ
jgi:hypothetical protein